MSDNAPNKEILLRTNTEAIISIKQEVKRKRESGLARSISDVFLIRLLEALDGDAKVFLFKKEKNTFVVRKYDSATINREIN